MKTLAGHVLGGCNTLGEFVQSPKDGQFDADCYESIKNLSVRMREHICDSGDASKDSLQRHHRALTWLKNVARALSVYSALPTGRPCNIPLSI